MAALVPLATVAVAGLQIAQTVAASRQQRQVTYPVQQQTHQVQQQQAAIDHQDLAQQEQRQQTVATEDLNTIMREQGAADRRRSDALRRAVARQRARLGARGIDATAGSGEALLLGMVEQSALDKADEHRDTRSRYHAVQRGLEHQQRLNLLDRGRLANRDRLSELAWRGREAGRSGDALATAGTVASGVRSLATGLHGLL